MGSQTCQEKPLCPRTRTTTPSYLQFASFKGKRLNRPGPHLPHQKIIQRPQNRRAPMTSGRIGSTVFMICVSWILTLYPIYQRHLRIFFSSQWGRRKNVLGGLPLSTLPFFALRCQSWLDTGFGVGSYPEKDSQTPRKNVTLNLLEDLRIIQW